LTKQDDPKTIAQYIQCLSKLESNTSQLYSAIAKKSELPLVKALFQEIAIDSQKHFTILDGISKSIAQVDVNPKECGNKIGESWRLIEKAQKEIGKMEKIDASNINWLVKQLAYFESIMGEEYYIFVQLKTLEILVKEINSQYKIDLQSTKKVFSKIIEDENHHRELLETIQKMVAQEEKDSDNSPVVKYQNPDAWSQAMPTTF